MVQIALSPTPRLQEVPLCDFLLYTLDLSLNLDLSSVFAQKIDAQGAFNGFSHLLEAYMFASLMGRDDGQYRRRPPSKLLNGLWSIPGHAFRDEDQTDLRITGQSVQLMHQFLAIIDGNDVEAHPLEPQDKMFFTDRHGLRHSPPSISV